jgi:hypothetical protein
MRVFIKKIKKILKMFQNSLTKDVRAREIQTKT